MMPEAEVALSFALHLFKSRKAHHVDVALDGAQVRLGERVIFPVKEFLSKNNWHQENSEGKSPWNGNYVDGSGNLLHVHAKPGRGDVVAQIGNRRYVAECKKGPLQRRRGNPEYKLLREAIGQLMTTADVKKNDLLVAVVPKSQKFLDLITTWKKLSAIKRAKINFACVSKQGEVAWF